MDIIKIYENEIRNRYKDLLNSNIDIDDLTKKEESTTKEDLLKVYGSLKCGSRNHLRSFNYQVELNDGEYEPEFISTEEFESIVNSEHEKCK